jgi:hypothetical protein
MYSLRNIAGKSIAGRSTIAGTKYSGQNYSGQKYIVRIKYSQPGICCFFINCFILRTVTVPNPGRYQRIQNIMLALEFILPKKYSFLLQIIS